MLGVRSEQNKTTTRQLPPFTGIKRKIKLDIDATFKADLPSSLTLSTDTGSVSVTGDTPQTALTAPMSADDFARNLTKLGGTPYEASNIKIDCDDGLMLPVSRLNALRRSAVEKLCENPSYTINTNVGREAPTQRKQKLLTASFADPSQISDTAKEYFDILYLPLDRYDGSVNGVVMPPVIFDHETEYVDSLLKKAKELGATEILIGNIAHIELAKKHGFNIHGDLRLNITNTQTVAALEKLGFSDMILSPELTLPQLRDIKGNTSAVVYGRLPMMLLEKCAICEVSGCKGKSTKQLCYAELTDRKGVTFPMLREGLHRNVIYNSLPTNMSDRADELTRYGISSKHFIFSTEDKGEIERVISAFKANAPLPQQVRRINK
jgi:putative protease